MVGFARITEILDAAVGGPDTPVGGPHRAFWRNQTRDQFVGFSLFGMALVSVGDGEGSTLVKALRGQEPFGQDIGTPNASFRRMPAGRPPVPDAEIAVVAEWIDDGCPDEPATPLGQVDVSLGGAPSGAGFVLVSDDVASPSASLLIRSVDGGEGEVSVRVGPASVAALSITPDAVHLSAEPVELEVRASTVSATQNDTTIEIVQGNDVLATYDLTAITAPAVRFTGRFQCRLATDPDPFDHPRGERSSFGVYAVQGPDPANPDEPPLDRIVRFHDAVALRPFCPPIGVVVTAIEAEVGSATVRFTAGDPLLQQPVRLGPACVFDGRNRTFAPDGFEPISDFRLEIGTVFSGASAPAVPRSSPQEPPGSTAPYANGVLRLDVDTTAWAPSDFGYTEATWAEHAWAVVARKLASLVAQRPSDERSARIRARRIQEHAVNRLGAIGFPIQLLERYSGLIDREITVVDGPVGVLAYLATLPAIHFSADFFDFDTDCQTGTVAGTLGPPLAQADEVVDAAAVKPLRRRAPPGEWGE
jgi:hypothetical protein